MKKRVFVLLLGLSLFVKSKAQETFSESKSLISFNLISPLDMYTPRWRIGYTYFLQDKWAVSTDLGFCNTNIAIHKGRISDEYLFWDIRPEIKYVFRKHRSFSPYIAAELFYMHHTEKKDNYFYKPDNSENRTHFEKADYLRQKYGVNLKGGFFAHLFGQISLETYFGIGYKINDTRYSNLVNLYIMEYDDEDEFTDYRVNEGFFQGLNITLGAKLNLVFKPNYN